MSVRIRPVHDKLIDLFLLVGIASLSLSHENVFSQGSISQKVRVYQGIVEYDFGSFQGSDPLESDKIRIARSGPDKSEFSEAMHD
jgi:hypothetical protein